MIWYIPEGLRTLLSVLGIARLSFRSALIFPTHCKNLSWEWRSYNCPTAYIYDEFQQIIHGSNLSNHMLIHYFHAMYRRASVPENLLIQQQRNAFCTLLKNQNLACDSPNHIYGTLRFHILDSFASENSDNKVFVRQLHVETNAFTFLMYISTAHPVFLNCCVHRTKGRMEWHQLRRWWSCHVLTLEEKYSSH